MALNVATICTDADLATKVGGMSELDRINKNTAVRDQLRASALEDVVGALLSRSPPVNASDLTDPTQLKNAVAYRTLSLLYRVARTSEGDRSDSLSKSFQGDYEAAMRQRFTVSAGQTSPSGGTFSYERR